MFETTDWLAPQLPAEKPRYFMGIGDPEGILEVIEAGVDMFDCVLPTRTARTGSALTWEGRLNLRNAQLRPRPGAARRELRLPGLHDVLAGLHPPPREPGRAARPAPALAPQSTLRPRADPPRPRGDRAAATSARTSATRSSARPTWATRNRHRHPRRRRAGSSSRCPRGAASARTRRCRTRSWSATRSSPPAASTRSCGRRARDELRIEIAPGRRRHPRPPGGCGRRARRSTLRTSTIRGRPENDPDRKLTCSLAWLRAARI